MVTVAVVSIRTLEFEMRIPAFVACTRVQFVDQWGETVGTMDGAVHPVGRQGGTVAGLIAITIENNEKTAALPNTYPCVSGVLTGTSRHIRCDRQ